MMNFLGFLILICTFIGGFVLLRFCWQLVHAIAYGCSYVRWNAKIAGNGSAWRWFRSAEHPLTRKIGAMWDAFTHILVSQPTEVSSGEHVWRGFADWKIGKQKGFLWK